MSRVEGTQWPKIMTTMVTVNVPDGIFAGEEFLLEYEGQQLTVTCPDGCGPGSEINLEIPIPEGGAGPSEGGPPQMVEISIPDGQSERGVLQSRTHTAAAAAAAQANADC